MLLDICCSLFAFHIFFLCLFLSFVLILLYVYLLFIVFFIDKGTFVCVKGKKNTEPGLVIRNNSKSVFIKVLDQPQAGNPRCWTFNDFPTQEDAETQEQLSSGYTQASSRRS